MEATLLACELALVCMNMPSVVPMLLFLGAPVVLTCMHDDALLVSILTHVDAGLAMARTLLLLCPRLLFTMPAVVVELASVLSAA